MQTLEFFQRVLPATGPYYMVALGPSGQRHMLMPSLEVLAEKSLAVDKNGNEALYFATATYRDAYVMKDDPANPGKQKKAWRVPENRLRLKSFFVDIDCGEEKAALGKGYRTKKDAVSALQAFCADLTLPLPIIVDSGGGLHCYWPLTKDISHEKWSAVAAAFKRATLERSFLVDPSRTADSASILRTPGTYNRKQSVPRAVTVKHPGAGPISPEDFVSKLQGHGGAGSALGSHAAIGPIPEYLRSAAGGNALAKHKTEYPPASAVEIAKKCQQLAAMRDTQGQVEYPIWFASIGLIKHCTEGLELAQEWSQGDPSYSEYATATKFHSWEKGPPTCEFFYGSNPTGCDGCKYRENDGSFKYTSPIQLGTVAPTPAPAMQLQVQITPGAAPVTIERPELPDGYNFEGGRLVRYLADKEGDLQVYPMTEADFYVYGWSNEDNVFAAQCRLHQPQGGIIEFDLPMKVVNSASDLLKELSGRSIMPTNNKDAGMHLGAYIRDSITKIKEEQQEMRTYSAFGWKSDMSGFLLGERMFNTDGSIESVRLSNNAERICKDILPGQRGTLAGYVDAMNFVYGREGMEPMQYAYCNAFGSLLTPFSTETLYRGVMFAITGGRTARGKTTVANAALYAFGDARRMTHTKTTTINARYTTMGTHGNLSMLFDEFTDIKPEELSEWAYAISEGREKSRLQAGTNGVSIAKVQEWAMAPYVTANTDMLERLAQHRGNTHAEAMRIVQLSIDDYDLPQLVPSDVSTALYNMSQNMGWAGEAYVEYITKNTVSVAAQCAKNMTAAAQILSGPELRYYRAHMSCTLTAAEILVDLGIARFDMERLWAFAADMYRRLVTEVQEHNVVNTDDILGRMVNHLAPGFITTHGYMMGGRVAPEDCRPPYNGVVGRFILGNPQTAQRYHRNLMVSRAAILKWCAAERVRYADIIEAAQKAGALISEGTRITLTSGTTVTGAPVPCVVFDGTKLDETWMPPLQAVA